MLKIKRTMLSASVLVALAGCGGDVDNLAPNSQAVTIVGAKTWLNSTGKFAVSDVEGNPLTITAISQNGKNITPVAGVYKLATGDLTINGLNFVYTPIDAAAAEFTYTVSDGELTSSSKVTIAAAKTDPLAHQQWHLRNTGQTAYAMSSTLVKAISELYQLFYGIPQEKADQMAAARLDPSVLKPGEDMNVASAFAQGVTGANTIAVVVDSGMEIRHEDLVENVLPNRSLNFVQGVLDPTDPTNTAAEGDHGTSVAGLIAAKGWNGIGGRGVAPDAQLIGFNYLEAQTNVAELLIHGHPGSGISTQEPIAVFNRSYGMTIPAALAYSATDEETQAYSANVLRNGKGAVNVKAAGNSYQDGRAQYDGTLCTDNGANDLGLTCYNGNFEPSQATPYYVVVGAVNSDGGHTSYSTAGANLLVSAPAGEYGTFAPAMVTTDQMTCLRGYSSFAEKDYFEENYFPGFYEKAYPFNNPGHPDNVSCNYTSTFNGTSSAAPNTSGVVALILSANPALTYRDVRDILVKSSTKVSVNDAKVSLDVADGKFVAHDAWVKNAAGYEFNNNFGYGRVNAGKAVQLAKSHTPLSSEKVTAWNGVGAYAAKPAALAQQIPDNSKTGTTITLTVAEDVKVEAAQFKLSVANTGFNFGENTADGYVQSTAGMDLAIEVISPAGTRSVLLSSKQALIYPALDENFNESPGFILKDNVFLSNAFYGESAKGTWTIRFLDVNGAEVDSKGGILGVDKYVNNSTPSLVSGAAIRVFGR
jgi:subtilisin family serine protease